MTSENSIEALGIDIEAWRQEVNVFAEETQQTLNAIGDMLISGNQESATNDDATRDPLPAETQHLPESTDQSGTGRLDQLRAKLAQKISDKQT